MHYWVIVVSKNHIDTGVEGGFIMANHGKEAPLKRMTKGDWVLCYSPKQSMEGSEPLKSFTAIGEVEDEDVYQVKMNTGFEPFRRNIKYSKCHIVPIEPLIGQLDFIKNKSSWGYQFRFGFFEIPQKDFQLIKSKMLD